MFNSFEVAPPTCVSRRARARGGFGRQTPSTTLHLLPWGRQLRLPCLFSLMACTPPAHALSHSAPHFLMLPPAGILAPPRRSPLSTLRQANSECASISRPSGGPLIVSYPTPRTTPNVRSNQSARPSRRCP